MNKSLKNLFAKISSDEKLFSQLISKNTIDEMYQFCKGIDKEDYSKDEFEHAVIKLIRELIDYRKLLDEDLENVGGGRFSLLRFIKDLLGVCNPITAVKDGFNLGQKVKGYFS